MDAEGVPLSIPRHIPLVPRDPSPLSSRLVPALAKPKRARYLKLTARATTFFIHSLTLTLTLALTFVQTRLLYIIQVDPDSTIFKPPDSRLGTTFAF